VKAEIKFTT